MSTGASSSRLRVGLGIGWGAAVLVALMLAAWALGLVTPPFRHEGRTVAEWLELLNGASTAEQARTAEAAFRAMGAKAVPGLASVLRERPWSLRVRLREVWHRWLGGNRPQLSYDERQWRALRALVNAAMQPAVELAPLIQDLRYHLDQRSEIQAAVALSMAGPDGIACLTNRVESGSPQIRDIAGFALSREPEVRRQPGAKSALTRAALAADDPWLLSRLVLYLSLFEEDDDAPILVPLALDALKSPDAPVRRSGVELMGRLRADPRADPALRRALKDVEPTVSTAAQRLLGGPGVPPPRPR